MIIKRGKYMSRIDIRDITEEQLGKIDNQVKVLGLKSRSDYIRLIIELDSATGLIQILQEYRELEVKRNGE